MLDDDTVRYTHERVILHLLVSANAVIQSYCMRDTTFSYCDNTVHLIMPKYHANGERPATASNTKINYVLYCRLCTVSYTSANRGVLLATFTAVVGSINSLVDYSMRAFAFSCRQKYDTGAYHTPYG